MYATLGKGGVEQRADTQLSQGADTVPNTMSALPVPKPSSRRSGDLNGLVVFDGDDTLWMLEPLYDAARQRAGEIVGTHGLAVADWDRLQRKIDITNAGRMGLSARRFPLSCVMAYQILARDSGFSPSPDAEDEIRGAANGVYDLRAPMVATAQSVLDHLRHSYRLVLLTQGEQWVQERRISDSGLADYFDAVYIVNRKTPQDFQKVMDEIGAKPADSWSVGNSLASDINPALDRGMSAVWIDAAVWGYERRETVPHPGTLYAAKELAEVPALVAQPTKQLVGV